MIAGIGCDLCSPERIARSLAGSRGEQFARRVFGPEELALLGLPAEQPLTRRQAERAAANFAAKEAFLKAVGTGLAAPFSLIEIQALRLESGAPVYRFSGCAAEWLVARQLTAHLSLSHERELAQAFCVLERQG